MRVYIASDHAGYELKEALNVFLNERGVQVEDLGPKMLDPQDDYPDYLTPLGARVASDHGSFGIGLGASGQGEAMAVNRVKGARAAVYYGGPRDIITLSREHNDANILSLGARFLTQEQAKDAVWTWLNTPFSNEERHVRRVKKLGFTLVEIMVVITIIGLLAGIVFASVGGGRGRASDTVIAGYVQDYKLLFDVEGAQVRSYAALKSGSGWRADTGDCSAFTGPNAQSAQTICEALVNATAGCASTPNCLYIGATTLDSPQKYTIMAALPGASAEAGVVLWVCMGSSGSSSVGPTNPGPGNWEGEGCLNNP